MYDEDDDEARPSNYVDPSPQTRGGGAAAAGAGAIAVAPDNEAKQPNAAQKLLLQYFVSQRVVSDKQLAAKFKQITEYYHESTEEADLVEIIGRINKAIHFMWLEIRKGVSESTGEIYWGLINLRNDDHAQMSTDYSITELDFFKRIIKAIITESDGSGEIGTNEALNLEGVQKMTKKEGEELINSLTKDGWLYQARGYLSLGVRTLLELRPYLTDIYEEHLVECVLCQDIVVKGKSCSNEKCRTRMHDHCSRRWFEGKENAKCPTCSSPWPHV